MLTSYGRCWNPSLGTRDVKWRVGVECQRRNEFGSCLDPDLAGAGFLSSLIVEDQDSVQSVLENRSKPTVS